MQHGWDQRQAQGAALGTYVLDARSIEVRVVGMTERHETMWGGMERRR